MLRRWIAALVPAVAFLCMQKHDACKLEARGSWGFRRSGTVVSQIDLLDIIST